MNGAQKHEEKDALPERDLAFPPFSNPLQKRIRFLKFVALEGITGSDKVYML
jgi:hypothetical protein